MIQLFKGPPAMGLSDLSPFCAKVETWLRLKQLPYKPRSGNPLQAPKGKIPWAKLSDGTVVSDSSDILTALEERHGALPAEAELSPAQRTLGHLLQRTLEEHLYFVALHFRYVATPNTFPLVKQALVSTMPPVVGPLVAHLSVAPSARKIVHFQGISRHSDEEVLCRARADLAAVADVLGDTPWLFGDAPTRFDATAYAMLAVCALPRDTRLAGVVAEFPHLVAYVDRITTDLFPELTA